YHLPLQFSTTRELHRRRRPWKSRLLRATRERTTKHVAIFGAPCLLRTACHRYCAQLDCHLICCHACSCFSLAAGLEEHPSGICARRPNLGKKVLITILVKNERV